MKNAKGSRPRRPGPLLGALLAAVSLLGLAGPAQALAAPALGLATDHLPTSGTVPAGSYAQYAITVSNTGTTSTSGAITVDFTAPAGLRVSSVTDEIDRDFGAPMWDCAIAPDSLSVSCAGLDPVGANYSGPHPISAGADACVDLFSVTCRIIVTVKADPLAPLGPAAPAITACGGGASACPAVAATAAADPIEIVPREFDVKSFDGTVLRRNGAPATQAGSHPHTAGTDFFATTQLDPSGAELPVEDIRDAVVNVPAGLVGNPQAIPTCTQTQLFGQGNLSKCSPESQVGTITLHSGRRVDPPYTDPPYTDTQAYGVYNMEAPKGLPALFGANIGSFLVQVYPELRTGSDYGLTVTAKNAAQTVSFEGVRFTFWGVPADPAHDPERWCPGEFDPGCPSSDSADPRPFISLPTSCVGPVETFLDLFGWQGGLGQDSFLSHDNTFPVPNPIGAEGCASVPFDPSLTARPTTNVADAPSGLEVELRVPQDTEDPDGVSSAHLRDTVVTLPEGLVVNPSGANGLDACSLAQFGYTSTDPDGTVYTTPDAATCPDAAKLATVEVDTPLLDHTLRGAAYIAQPHQNPFNSLLALYIAIDDPETGIVAKLAGEVRADPQTGQLSAGFQRSPQLPFESFRLHFFGGAGGALRTPATCGQFTTTTELTPWTAPDAGSSLWLDSWSIDQGQGGACATSPAELPHAPSFDAGAVSPIAGTHSPFVVHLRREDGSQNFSAVTLTPPQGLVAKLAGTPACSEADLASAASKSGQAERANPSCPLASQVGIVDVAAGAGPAPYHAQGKAYLSGPYKGAPLSLAIVTPATAGPFDLGTVVVKTALHVNSKTAEITALSDPLPTILQGIPLDIRTASISLDKPNFTLNPTSCDPMAVNGLLTSTLGAVANLSSRFQLGECGRLGFKPKMALRLRGGTKRGKYPQLTIALMPRPGDANIASVSVAMPRSEFLANEHIRTPCTRPDFAADACPKGAVYGTATVDTPLLDYDLSGNVYLRSSDNLLPDVVPDLRGPSYQPIRLETAGRTDSIRGGIRTTIDFVPDAPFTKATVALQGGNKGLLVNSRNICARTYRATVRFVGHNGARHTIRPKLVAQSCKKKKRRKAKRSSHSRSKRMALATRSSVR